jgi:hypothetical protein
VPLATIEDVTESGDSGTVVVKGGDLQMVASTKNATIAKLLHEAAETHHHAYRIAHGPACSRRQLA